MGVSELGPHPSARQRRYPVPIHHRAGVRAKSRSIQPARTKAKLSGPTPGSSELSAPTGIDTPMAHPWSGCPKAASRHSTWAQHLGARQRHLVRRAGLGRQQPEQRTQRIVADRLDEVDPAAWTQHACQLPGGRLQVEVMQDRSPDNHVERCIGPGESMGIAGNEGRALEAGGLRAGDRRFVEVDAMHAAGTRLEQHAGETAGRASVVEHGPADGRGADGVEVPGFLGNDVR
jgi:hypothetical protein